MTLDCLREVRPPFSPEQVTEDFAALLKTYGLSQVIADRFGGGWVVEQFAHFGITVEQAAKPKSDLYVDLLALLNSKRVELLDHPRLFSQLIGLGTSGGTLPEKALSIIAPANMMMLRTALQDVIGAPVALMRPP